MMQMHLVPEATSRETQPLAESSQVHGEPEKPPAQAFEDTSAIRQATCLKICRSRNCLRVVGLKTCRKKLMSKQSGNLHLLIPLAFLASATVLHAAVDKTA